MLYMFLFLLVAVGLITVFASAPSGFNSNRKTFRMDLKAKTRQLNTPYHCDCGITSRKYQLANGKNCPHCGRDIYMFSKKMPIGKYPFAPELTKWEVIDYRRNEEQLEQIADEISRLKSYDAEIQAWEDLQRKKIAEQERIIKSKF